MCGWVWRVDVVDDVTFEPELLALVAGFGAGTEIRELLAVGGSNRGSIQSRTRSRHRKPNLACRNLRTCRNRTRSSDAHQRSV